jgi:hypothetical protein
MTTGMAIMITKTTGMMMIMTDRITVRIRIIGITT